ncbi:site-specific DNA-methyltransferase [Tumebacillus permanentifrigoris]|uniref:Adenine-specific DNA-methyltransferase n=1 Tax=Tumebacillus permanentifrigoris TaxID=378543 RepID=A0A316DAU0_9BACL|nr:site-specific DNA-methyltransferase [Tumebacillus permanentifrigoris]PWK14448.1 adenine-specific DNA-methyltransferase [Tumebacillus permanentifrigoris]
MRIIRELCVGSKVEQAKNMMIEGDNIKAMRELHQHFGQIDLIVTDPPYNTGQSFRYNDKWDGGDTQSSSRHPNWLDMMRPRLQMMHEMLKPGGILAICIDDKELFQLGLMMNNVFGERNRIAIINWQKSYAPKNDSRHVSSATEYILVYAREKEKAKTGLLSRDEEMNSKYKNPDHDSVGDWRSSDPTASTPAKKDRYAIQSPFTGALHYPGCRAWSHPKSKMKEWLEAWGCRYEERYLQDGRAKALVLHKAPTPNIPTRQNLDNNFVVESDEVFHDPRIVATRQRVEKLRDHHAWPVLYFASKGKGRPAMKCYLKDVRQGKVPFTYWADEEYEESERIGVQSWGYKESGHSQTGINEINAIMGKGHQFQTVKPLKLIKKIIQLWCPPKGIVLDPFAGSGTTAHAVMELNRETGADRRFILIEQGNPETGDQYARSLTQERVRRIITGERLSLQGQLVPSAEPLKGGFVFKVLQD